MPYSLQHDFEGVQTAFVHYALATSGRGFLPLVKTVTSADLDEAFIYRAYLGGRFRASPV